MLVFNFILFSCEEDPVGIIENTSREINPNPVADNLWIEFISSILNRDTSLFIYNTFGRLVYQSDISTSGQTVQINTENWDSGLYIMNLISDRILIATKKIIVN